MTALEGLLEDATAGDPITGLKWTHRSLRKLSKALRRRGIKLAANTIARLLRDRDFALRTNRKRLAGTHDPQRDRQFRYLVRMCGLYLARGLPVISVDTKKKEWVGTSRTPADLGGDSPGTCWTTIFPVGRSAGPSHMASSISRSTTATRGRHLARDPGVRRGRHPPLVDHRRPSALPRGAAC